MATNNGISVFEYKKKQYLERIDLIAKESFNNEQKIVAKQIIESANENNIDAIYQLVTQRVKTGFVFDAAPEVNHNCVALVTENEVLNIYSSEAIQNEHSLIIGENYEGLKNLLCTYINPSTGEGVVDVIYIDPPYNTESAKKDGNDYKDEVEATKFVYRDKFTRDGWLNMMNERITLARKILSSQGIIYISINENEHAYLKVLCDSIFGEVNYVSSFIWKSKLGKVGTTSLISTTHENILCYAKDIKKVTIDQILKVNNGRKENLRQWGQADKRSDRESMYFPISIDGIDIYPIKDDGTEGRWRVGVETAKELLEGGKLIIESKKGKSEIYRIFDSGYSTSSYDSMLSGLGTTADGTKTLKSLKLNGKFDYPKPVNLIKHLIKIYSNKEAIFLDFFAGSGTSGQAVMELNAEDGGNRKFILVTNNENNIAIDVTRERLYRVINGKGSNNEQIDWKYSDTTKSLLNNSVRVFEIEYHELELNDFEKAKKLIPIAEEQFKKLNPNYKAKGRFDIYNDLASLNPYKKV